MDNRVDHHQKSVGEEGSSWKRNKSCSSIFSLVSSLVVFLLFLSPGTSHCCTDLFLLRVKIVEG